MSEDHKNAAGGCEECGSAGPLEYDKEGRQLCAKCRAHSTVKELGAAQLKAGMVRRCPTCGPTMYGTEEATVGASSRGNVSGVTFSGSFRCGKCGRTVSIFPKTPTVLRGVLVMILPVSFVFVPDKRALYVLAPLWGIFAIFALIDLIQRLRYPLVRS
jgi:DNA-directed RNA polymerase subunit RPC12/RpoP